MNPIVVIRAEILCVAIICYLIGYARYCAKYHQGEKNFLLLAYLCLIHGVFSLVTEFTVNIPSCPRILNDICHIIFFASALLFCLALFRYTLNLVLPANKVKFPMGVAISICAIGIIIATSSKIHYLKGEGTFYSVGLGPSVCFATGVVIFLAVVIILAFNRKRIEKSVIAALLPITSIAFIGMIVQVLIPEFLFTSGVLTLVLTGAFFAIENPIDRIEDRANIDLDTHARNRNAYEKDFAELKKRAAHGKIEFPLMYVICDINGLKTVNDTYGHLEGDKLIFNAATILMDKLKSCSNIYRIGGDEFAVLYEGVRICTVEDEIKSISEACEKVSKSLVTPLTISIGSAIYDEGTDIEDLVRIADERMYKNKDAFYTGKGINRRKVQDYASVFRDETAKILKINLTDDTFAIIKVSLDEKKTEEGYSDCFSEWTKGLLAAGYVHEDSLELFNEKVNIENWKKHFDESNEKISFIYRRKFKNEYYQAFVEVVRGNEYRPDHQIVFLFVKNLGIK